MLCKDTLPENKKANRKKYFGFVTSYSDDITIRPAFSKRDGRSDPPEANGTAKKRNTGKESAFFLHA
jgi:hypothetical protein